MSRASLGRGDDLSTHLRTLGGREDSGLAVLRRAIATYPRAQMRIAPEQGQFLVLLMEPIGASH